MLSILDGTAVFTLSIFLLQGSLGADLMGPDRKCHHSNWRDHSRPYKRDGQEALAKAAQAHVCHRVCSGYLLATHTNILVSVTGLKLCLDAA